ncbi:response regulator transcription factor [Lacrimispora sp. NSJ-141]|uniref:Stage 0 sporulation protein A homolog n=1 Tax=Lientehia hominis TaxID=2897778 RepID=A0AAP2RJE5_9FIRM|nr:response regulator transcription factor [Lientehia hominis]MCD2492514.1 response regulator transcription factor [Lientehia hominis]
MELIYVIEDDENIRELIRAALVSYGYQVEAFEAAEPALSSIVKDRPSLAIFDLMLPGMDGLEAIEEIRKDPQVGGVPIIVLTAKDKEFDKVIGLDRGADDYMTKPFSVLELAARVRSQLRRESGKGQQTAGRLEEGSLLICPDTREVFLNGEMLHLTLKEYELLKYLAENKTRVVTREQILNQIWGYEYEGESRTLDMHVRSLRQKLGEGGTEMIRTVRGVGYRFYSQEKED